MNKMSFITRIPKIKKEELTRENEKLIIENEKLIIENEELNIQHFNYCFLDLR
jgi:hypothetical protein